MKTRGAGAQPAWFWPLAALFAGLAALLTLRATSLFGVGLSPDSVGFALLARRLSADGAAFLGQGEAIEQPPGYPATLALLANLTGAGHLAVARAVNAACSALLVILGMLGVARATAFPPLTFASGLLGCFSVPLVLTASMAWTEPLFMVTIYCVLLLLTGPRPTLATAALGGLLTAGACLTRYAGALLIPLFTAYLLSVGAEPLTRRLKLALAFAVTPCTLLALYLVRNHALSGHALGPRAASRTGLAANAYLTARTVASWCLPHEVGSWPTWGMASLVAVSLAAFVVLGRFGWSHRSRVADALRGAQPTVGLHAAFILSYTGFIVWASTSVALDGIDSRLLAPVYPALLVVAAPFMKPEVWGSNGRAILVLCLVGVLWGAGPFRAVVSAVEAGAHEGVGLNSRTWRESPLLGHLARGGPPPGEVVFSNVPEVLALFANVSASFTPAQHRYNSDEGTGLTTGNLFLECPGFDGALLVWFEHAGARDYFFTPDQLRTMCSVRAVAEFEDGGIFRIASSRTTAETTAETTAPNLGEPRR